MKAIAKSTDASFLLGSSVIGFIMSGFNTDPCVMKKGVRTRRDQRVGIQSRGLNSFDMNSYMTIRDWAGIVSRHGFSADHMMRKNEQNDVFKSY